MHNQNTSGDVTDFSVATAARGGWTAVIFNTILCTAIAVIFTAAGGKFYENMVFSHCIGWSAYSFCQIYVKVFWRNQIISPLGLLLMLTVGVGCGFFVGQSIAAMILGMRISYASFFSFANWPTFVTAAVGTTIALTFFTQREKRLRREITAAKLGEKTQTVRRELADAQLHLVRAQVEPHMLFNTLANLRALITEDQQKAVTMLDHLNGFLRASLNRNRQSTISLGQEFELLTNYLELMKVRLDSRLTYQLHLPETLRNIQIPTWLLQPIVENAITHGLEPSLAGGSIEIHASCDHQSLMLSVLNTGEPLPVDFNLNQLVPRVDGGFGLYQCRERIGQLFDGKASLKVRSIDQKTHVIITIPMEHTA